MNSPKQLSDELSHRPGIPVIAIGGSAGALTSFETFFEAMPADSGAAFVVIQHLSPTHESLLPELLAKYTRMRVVEAHDNMSVEPNCLYVIPPTHHVGIRNGVLFLTQPILDHGVHTPIDFFFRCLAEDREERAICILFSGAGMDGTLGARAIRAGGGLVVAQDPATSQFEGMPRSAIAAGLADHVLAPEQMPQAILQYLQHPYVKWPARDKVLEEQANPKTIQDILSLVLDQTGSEFRCYKPGTILRRIRRRMGLFHIADMAQYAAHLRQSPGEVQQLVKDMLINVTSFFRDGEAFNEVREKVFAPLVESRADDEPLRVWVPACATGEEAYSLTILLMEELARTGKKCPLQVFATDLDEEALEVGRAGLYPQSIHADVGEELLLKYFVRKEEGYQVKESLRAALTFATQNVISAPPFSKMDLISCRNLLIYLDADAQTKLMAVFNFALKPGGYLFLGRSESVAGQNDLFETVSNKGRLCRRLAPTRPLLLDSPILSGRRRPAHLAHAMDASVTSTFADVIRLEILRHFGASAVLVDRKGKILQFHGQADRFLKLPAPGPDFNVFVLARERLSSLLRLAMRQAIQDGTTVVLESVEYLQESGSAFARITAVPVSQKNQAKPLLVVFFEDASPPPSAQAEVIRSPASEAIIKRLEEELQATQQDLQATIEELQSFNEELRAANEEVTATNEELESANEELVSSTEELQSTNEELTAVISQLQEKVSLLDTSQDSLQRSEQRLLSLVECLPNAVVLTSEDGTITLVNRQAQSLFGYEQTELVGLAVEVLMSRENHPSLRAAFNAGLGQCALGAGGDLLAVRKDGREFPAEIFLTPLDMPQGLVIMVIITDITQHKRHESGR
ncbi:MAG: chemotaxis protein CheB [Planctomycetaceae bacterium]|nr:PAS domain S-box protein [Planctomycetaceae bacterium]